MKDDNWTDFKHPCFQEFSASLEPLSRDDFIDRADLVEDCDAYRDRCGGVGCPFMDEAGGTWATCSEGGLYRHCPNSIKPKEATNA